MRIKNIDKFAAVFIDGDWLYTTAQRIGKKVDYSNLIRTLRDKFGKKTRVYFYGAINPKDKRQNIFYKTLKRNGYLIRLERLIKTEAGFISKGVEIALATDAMQLLSSFEKFVLVSGDGDFVPLLEKIKKAGVEISVIALPFTAGYFMRKAVGGNFFNLEKFLNGYDKKSRLIMTGIKKNRKTFPESMYIEKGDQLSSYVYIRNLIFSAKKSITIIDQYLDEQIILLIDLLNNPVDIKILTRKKIDLKVALRIKELREKGTSVMVCGTNNFHDRFIGIDDSWWHSGHSFKDLGKKSSFLSKIIVKKEQLKLKKNVEDEIKIAELIL